MTSKIKHTFEKLKTRMIVLVLAGLAVGIELSAKSMRDLWISMPDSMVSYISKSVREECAALMDMKMKAEVVNSFGEKIVMDTLASDFVSVRLSEAASLQMRLLPVQGGDSVLCLARTYGGPVKESTVAIYTQEWSMMTDVPFDIAGFVHKPDTMPMKRFEELMGLLDPYLISVTLSPTDDTLVAVATAVNVSEEEARSLDEIFVQRKFKWNGKAFN